MKKLTLITLIAIAFVSCDDDPPATTSFSYPTDGLFINDTKNPLLFISYSERAGQSPEFQVAQKIAEDKFGSGFNTFSIGDNLSLFRIPAGNSIDDTLALGSAPSMYLNSITTNPTDLFDDIESVVDETTPVGVATVKSENDTAWIVDAKVRFFVDTLSSGFWIETYMLGNVDSRWYEGILDLTQAGSNNIVTQDSSSSWAKDFKNIDSTKTLVSQGSQYVHENILLANYSTVSSFGTNLGALTPFGIAFQRNDVIGTRDFPIRHYFLKPDSDPDNPNPIAFDFRPEFLTVIWFLDQNTGQISYIDSYRTQ